MATALPLVRFFVYDPTIGQTEETESDKVLYYWPSHLVTVDDKVSQVGLSEALVNFTRTFSKTKPCEVMFTDNHVHVFLNPETHYWMVLVAHKDVHDSVVHNQLKDLYNAFKLFNGTFVSIVAKSNRVQDLRDRMESFFPLQIPNLKFDDLGIDGIHFLPVGKSTYLSMVTFVNNIEYNFGAIKYTAFMIQDFLVWSGLPQEEISQLYKFVKRFNGGQGFWTGPTSTLRDDAPINIRPVWVGSQQFSLLIYRVEEAILLFITDLNVPMATYRELEKFILRNIGNMAMINRGLITPRPDEYRYFYFNHMNLAIKSSNRGIPKEYFNIVLDIRKDFDLNNNEIVVQTFDNTWVAGRRTDQRELYFVFEKKATLLDVQDEVRNLSAQYFNNIFV